VIREHLQRGAYQTVDQYVERAVSMLHQQEAWLATHRGEIESQIDYQFTPQATEDLLGIWSFIARDNRKAALGSCILTPIIQSSTIASRNRSLLHRHAVVRRHHLPLSPALHPYVGEPVVILVGFSIGFATFVICARHHRRVPVHPNLQV